MEDPILKWLFIAEGTTEEVLQWNSTFYEFSLIIDGPTEKLLQFIIPLSQFTTETLVSWNKNVFLNTTESFKQENIYKLTLFLPLKKVSVDLFRAAPYMLMLVLHKDVLFH
jgi:hypothetical protein